MGWQLGAAVLDRMPAGLSSGERCVVVAIAWSVKDRTRQGWITTDTLTRRAGLSESGLAKALHRLRDRGYELRVPIGQDDDEAPVYAYRGRSRTYRIPEEWSPHRETSGDDEAEKGLPTGRPLPANGLPTGQPFVEKGLPTGLERSPHRVGKVSPQGDPGSHGSHGSQSARARAREAVDYIAERLSVDRDDAGRIWDAMADHAGGPVHSPRAYARQCLTEDQDRWRPSSSTNGSRPDPACPECYGSGIATNAEGLGVPCPHCRRSA